ncbi:MAG: nitrite/sulfite reductase, partial [Sedimenticola sp.]
AYIDQVAHFFVRHPLTASMPRKIKFSFSGCAKDCAHGMAHDIGVIATHKDGKPGFKLLAAGGLGSCPREAFELEMFIEEDQLLASIGAVLTLHNQYSDRKRKMRSRTKFLVDKFGIDEFKAKYQDALLRTKDAFHMEAGRVAKWRTPTMKPEEVNTNLRTPVAQHQDDLNVLPVTVTNGEIKVSQLRALAELLEREGLNQLHTSQDQNFSVFNIPTDRLGAVTVALRDIGFKTPRCGDRVVSCPGTETCPLGITASRHIVPRLSGGVGDLAVRINGCQNGCANSAIAEIGLYGKGRRHYGRLVPSYGLNLGGDGGKGGGIGITGPDIPAVRIPSAVKIIHDDYHADRLPNENFCHFVKRVGNEYFEETLGHLSHVGSSEIAFLTRDHGDSSMFKVESLGIGECAGVTAAPADKLLFDAQYESELCAAFASKNKQDNAAESLVNQVLFIGRALLEATGCEPTDRYDLETINSKLQQEFKDEPDLLSQYTAFNNEVAAFQDTLDELVLSGLIKTADNLISQVEERVAELHRQTHIATTLMAQRSGTND